MNQKVSNRLERLTLLVNSLRLKIIVQEAEECVLIFYPQRVWLKKLRHEREANVEEVPLLRVAVSAQRLVVQLVEVTCEAWHQRWVHGEFLHEDFYL